MIKLTFPARLVASSLMFMLICGGFVACSQRPSQLSAAEASQGVQSASPAQQAPDTVWVARPDGAQSCEPKSGQTLDDGAAALKNAKVRVLEARKGNDGKMHIQMCGAPKGSVNSYLIPREDLPQAMAQGYVESK